MPAPILRARTRNRSAHLCLRRFADGRALDGKGQGRKPPLRKPAAGFLVGPPGIEPETDGLQALAATSDGSHLRAPSRGGVG
jgi:hypothetical protein